MIRVIILVAWLIIGVAELMIQLHDTDKPISRFDYWIVYAALIASLISR